MCELFGINGTVKLRCNELLEEFYSHAEEHPDGWGLATFCGNAVSLEKEPISARESVYLKHRLTDDIEEATLLAHIRKASVGDLQYKNSHPFAMRDASGRLWTLIHNGTIFESEELDAYKGQQKGATDSERILCCLIARMNLAMKEKRNDLLPEERFLVIEEMTGEITPKNKVNFLIYDGELFYVHMNHKDSLHRCRKERTLVVSTRPLDQDGWEVVPMNTVLGYRDGELVYRGREHSNEYIKTEEEKSCCQKT